MPAARVLVLARFVNRATNQGSPPRATDVWSGDHTLCPSPASITSRSCDTVTLMRPVSHDESERMRDALKTIASFLNPAKEGDGGQAAARLARKTLDELDLFIDDSRGNRERHAP